MPSWLPCIAQTTVAYAVCQRFLEQLLLKLSLLHLLLHRAFQVQPQLRYPQFQQQQQFHRPEKTVRLQFHWHQLHRNLRLQYNTIHLQRHYQCLRSIIQVCRHRQQAHHKPQFYLIAPNNCHRSQRKAHIRLWLIHLYRPQSLQVQQRHVRTSQG